MTITCDTNAANIHFLLEQSKIQQFESGEFIFNFYRGQTPNRNGWILPSHFSKEYISQLIKQDSSPTFILIDDEQKNLLEDCLKEVCPEANLIFSSDEGDSDYIYSVEKMADLPGKAFQKKRNHISKFMRNFAENWQFLFSFNEISAKNVEEMQKIYKIWLNSRKTEKQDDFLNSEEKSINIAFKDFNKLKLLAGILYAKGEPIAFLIGSFTSESCINVHFEKCLDEYADFGALSVLNQQFAKSVKKAFPNCQYLNREEDLNIPGLRKSKLSYQPEMLVQKYYGSLKKA